MLIDIDVLIEGLGTRWIITTPQPLPEEVINGIRKHIHDFENDYSRFKSQSLIGRLNDTKQLNNPPKKLYAMLHFALDAYRKSTGLFNISVGGLLESQGYGLQQPHPNSYISTDLTKDITLSENKIMLAPHIRIDLGGFGKGWLVDELHDYLNENGFSDHIINGGGDIRVGTHAEEIYIEHPLKSRVAVGSVLLENSAFAASSNIKRRWQDKNDTEHGHIINVAHEANQDILQACVRAETCAYADMVATVMCIASHKKRQKLAGDFGIEWMFVTSNLTIEQSPYFCCTAF